MEPARFIDREVYIDTETDWGDIDHVLVGTDAELVGVLCISDVFGRLNDFAEAFVLLYEIEHEIRDLIHDVYDDKELSEVLLTSVFPGFYTDAPGWRRRRSTTAHAAFQARKAVRASNGYAAVIFSSIHLSSTNRP